MSFQTEDVPKGTAQWPQGTLDMTHNYEISEHWRQREDDTGFRREKKQITHKGPRVMVMPRVRP